MDKTHKPVVHALKTMAILIMVITYCVTVPYLLTGDMQTAIQLTTFPTTVIIAIICVYRARKNKQTTK